MMKLWRYQQVLEWAPGDAQIAVDDDGLQRGKGHVDVQSLFAGTHQVQHQHDQATLDEDLNHMCPRTCQPVHGFHRMVDRMKQPQPPDFMEYPMFPVEYEIGHQNQQCDL